VDDQGHPSAPVIRTAVATDLSELRRVFKAAALSNAGDAPLLLARPEFLEFAGDGIADRRTRVAVAGRPGDDRIRGFATVAFKDVAFKDAAFTDVAFTDVAFTDVALTDGGLELEDLFVDPEFRRLGIARSLVVDAVETARVTGHRQLSVTGNPHALAFYQAVGFVEIGQTDTELGTGIRLRLEVT
jgi:GNAT superfamily N-acetyltransferase